MARGLNAINQEFVNAYAAGDKAKAKALFEEVQQRRNAQAEADKNDPTNNASALEGESGLSKFGLGMASGLVNVGRRVGQILTPKGLEARLGVSDADIEEQSRNDRELASTLPGMAGRLTTEMALTAPIGAGAGAAVRGLAGAARLAKGGLATRAAVLAGEGAAQGEVTSGNAGEGAAWNLGLGALGGLGSRLLRGSKDVTPEARRLMKDGVEMTPGQMNPKGVVSQLESGAERVPGIGPFIRNRREALAQTGAKRLIEREIGTAMPAGTSYEKMIETAYDDLGKQYDKVRASIGSVKPGGGHELTTAWRKAVNDADLLVSPDARNTVSKWLSGKISALKGKPVVEGKDLLKIRSDIREEIRGLAKAGDRASADQARILAKAEEAITAQIEHTLPAFGKQLLKDTDAAYAAYKPLENAGFQAAARPGGAPTITMLTNALKKSAGQSKWTGRGAGRNEQFVRDLRDVGQRADPVNGSLLPAAVVGAVTSPLLALGATKTGSRLIAGVTKPQLAAQRLLDSSKNTPYLRTLLELLRRGAAGALTDHTAEGPE